LSERLANGGSPPQSSGAAGAANHRPRRRLDLGQDAIEARLDPSQEQSKLGTSLSKSLPLSEQYSLTLQNGYNVIQPMTGMPGQPARNYEVDRSAN